MKEDIKVILFLGSILGMFYKTENTEKIKKFKYLLPLPCILTYTYILFKVNQSYNKYDYDPWEQIEEKSDLIALFLSIFTLYIKWFCYFLKRKKFNKILSNVILLDEANKNFTKTKRRFILKLISNVFKAFFLMTVDLLFLGEYDDMLEYYFVFFFCIIITQLEQTTTDEILKIILDFLLEINENLYSLREKKVTRRENIELSEIKYTRERYNFLWKLSSDANKLFGFQQLLSLNLTVCYIISYAYYLFSSISTYAIILCSFYWIIYLFSTVFYLLRGWCYLVSEVSVIFFIK